MKPISERTVRGMKETLKIFVSTTHMLLSHEAFNWPAEDYATYISLQEMSGSIMKSNPTKQQIMAVLVVWGKFCQSVSQRVPVDELRAKSIALYDQAVEPYAKWFKQEEKTK